MKTKTWKKAGSTVNKLMRNEFVVLALILVVSFSLRFYPAVTNEFPKGGDSFFHIRVAGEIKESDSLFLHDPLTGAVNPYPPVFHLLLAALFYFGDAFVVAKFIGPLLGFLSVAVFFVFMRRIAVKRIALASAFVYGLAADMINKSVTTTPENLGLLLIFSALYFFDRCLKEKNVRGFYLSAVFASLLALTHTLSFLMLIVFLLAFFGAERKIARLIIVPILVAIAWLAYTASLGASTTLIFYSPPGVDYVFAGVSVALFALAAAGAKDAFNFRLVVPAYIFLLFWLLFVPAYPERVLTLSVVLLSVLAGFGISRVINQENKSKYIVLAFLVIILLAHAVEIQNPFGYARTELTQQDYSVLLWAKDNLPADAVIASTWQVSGVWVQTIAERRTILGAFHESIPDYQQRRDDLAVMFTSTAKNEIEDIAAKYGASYIFIDIYEERALYAGAVNRLRSMFRVVMENEYARVFEI